MATIPTIEIHQGDRRLIVNACDLSTWEAAGWREDKPDVSPSPPPEDKPDVSPSPPPEDKPDVSPSPPPEDKPDVSPSPPPEDKPHKAPKRKQ